MLQVSKIVVELHAFGSFTQPEKVFGRREISRSFIPPQFDFAVSNEECLSCLDKRTDAH